MGQLEKSYMDLIIWKKEWKLHDKEANEKNYTFSNFLEL